VEPEEIKLDSIDKLFEYEKQCRIIDDLNIDELKKFSKLYCKFFLKIKHFYLLIIHV
jgi:hypothetical protein